MLGAIRFSAPIPYLILLCRNFDTGRVPLVAAHHRHLQATLMPEHQINDLVMRRGMVCRSLEMVSNRLIHRGFFSIWPLLAVRQHFEQFQENQGQKHHCSKT